MKDDSNDSNYCQPLVILLWFLIIIAVGFLVTPREACLMIHVAKILMLNILASIPVPRSMGSVGCKGDEKDQEQNTNIFLRTKDTLRDQ